MGIKRRSFEERIRSAKRVMLRTSWVACTVHGLACRRSPILNGWGFFLSFCCVSIENGLFMYKLYAL